MLEPHAPTDELDENNAFARLVLNPALRPMRMDDRWLDSFSSPQKKQWVEFAKRLEAFFHAGGSIAVGLGMLVVSRFAWVRALRHRTSASL